MASTSMLHARFPRINPEHVREELWRELPLTAVQQERLSESYLHTLRRSRVARYDFDCPGHVWTLPPHGPWVCEKCVTERWRL